MACCSWRSIDCFRRASMSFFIIFVSVLAFSIMDAACSVASRWVRFISAKADVASSLRASACLISSRMRLIRPSIAFRMIERPFQTTNTTKIVKDTRTQRSVDWRIDSCSMISDPFRRRVYGLGHIRLGCRLA